MATLDELRREIDEIDGKLHELLIRRVEIGREVAKAKVPGAGPNLRPGREAQVMRRLAERNRAPLSLASLARIWREILSANLNQQVSITAAVFAPKVATHDLAREYCGTASSLKTHNDAESVLASISEGSAQIGILPGLASGAAWRWWPGLLDRNATSRPRIIARLPFFADGSGMDDAMIVADQEPEASGDDRTLFAVRGETVLGDGEIIDRAENGETWSLVAYDGFIDEPAGAGETEWYRLGAHANPVAV